MTKTISGCEAIGCEHARYDGYLPICGNPQKYVHKDSGLPCCRTHIKAIKKEDYETNIV